MSGHHTLLQRRAGSHSQQASAEDKLQIVVRWAGDIIERAACRGLFGEADESYSWGFIYSSNHFFISLSLPLFRRNSLSMCRAE